MTLGEGLRKIRKGNKYTLTDVSKLAGHIGATPFDHGV